jgi:Holliday junction resolvase RusA-like endonuclease
MKTITLTTKPIPVNSKYGVINGRMLLTKKYRDTKTAISWEITSQWRTEPLTTPVTLNILQYFGDNRKRDIDAYIKILLDSMEGIVFENDNQVNEMHIYKEKDLNNPRTEIQIL